MGLVVWVKAQTDIYLAGLPGWVKRGWVVLMRFNVMGRIAAGNVQPNRLQSEGAAMLE